MKKLLFYAAVALLMPYLTVLVIEHAIGGGIPTFIGFAAACLCILLSAAFAQLAAIATASLRLVRRVFGGERSIEAPPSFGEKLFFAGGTSFVALSIYTITGIGLALGTDRGSGLFVVMMIGLGALYGGLMAYGLLSNLVDPHEVDALGVQPDPPFESEPRRRSKAGTKS